jgi:hypothetical protein
VVPVVLVLVRRRAFPALDVHGCNLRAARRAVVLRVLLELLGVLALVALVEDLEHANPICPVLAPRS